MTELSSTEVAAIRYMLNAMPTIQQFDEDNDPIGSVLRRQLVKKGAILVESGQMCTTAKGRKAAGMPYPDDNDWAKP